LGQTHNGVVNRAVTVWVIFTDYVPDDTGRFFVWFIPVVTQYIHREQNATVHRLQSITNIWQRTSDNYGHRVVQIRVFQLVFDVYRCDFSGKVAHGAAIPLLMIHLPAAIVAKV
jgi:hypothetical protein